MRNANLFVSDHVFIFHSLPKYDSSPEVDTVDNIYGFDVACRRGAREKPGEVLRGVQAQGAIQHKLWNAPELAPKAPLLASLVLLVDCAFLDQQGVHLRAALLISIEDPHLLPTTILVLVVPHKALWRRHFLWRLCLPLICNSIIHMTQGLLYI